MNKADAWVKEKERGSYWAIRCFVFLYKYGGHFLVSPIVYLVVTYFFLTKASTRRFSRSYLIKVALNTPHFKLCDVNSYLVWQHYLAFANALVYRISAWMGNTHYEDVDFKERDQLMGQQSEKKGCVILGAHFGNMDMCRALMTQSSRFVMNVVVNTQDTENFNRMLKAINPNIHVNLIALSSINPSTAIMIKEKLDQGESLVMLADRVSPGSEKRCLEKPFLGHNISLPEGAFRLAARLECPVYFMTCVRVNGAFQMKLKRLWDGVSGNKNSEKLNFLVDEYLSFLTELCSQYPLNWFNFYDYWGEYNHTR